MSARSGRCYLSLMHSSATPTVSAFGENMAPSTPCFRTMSLHFFRSVSISGCVKQNCESASPASSRPNTAHAAWDIAKRFSGWTYLSAGAQRVGPLYRLAHRSEQHKAPCSRQVLVHVQHHVGGRTPAPLPSSVSWLRSRGGCGSSVRSSSQPPDCNCPRGAPVPPHRRQTPRSPPRTLRTPHSQRWLHDDLVDVALLRMPMTY